MTSRFTFQVTQPPGQQPPVAEGEGTNGHDLMREVGHYHRMYAQDGRARVEVWHYEEGYEPRLLLMATSGARRPQEPSDEPRIER
jgi:hypothetical protein